jgi:hypothetical protein
MSGSPLLSNPFMEAIMSTYTTSSKISVPERYVAVAFVNRYLNSEDAVSVL